MAAASGEMQAAAMSWTTYIAAGIVVIMDLLTHYLGISLEFMDNHALGLGVMFGGITCVANIHFRMLERKDKLRQRSKRTKSGDL